jgi:hypothetical protein
LLLHGRALSSKHGRRIAFDGPGRTVIDGPFAATREVLAGFWLWEVKDMDDAVAWLQRCPNPMPGPSEIEIRPLNEAAPICAENLTPEVASRAAPPAPPSPASLCTGARRIQFYFLDTRIVSRIQALNRNPRPPG